MQSGHFRGVPNQSVALPGMGLKSPKMRVSNVGKHGIVARNMHLPCQKEKSWAGVTVEQEQVSTYVWLALLRGILCGWYC